MRNVPEKLTCKVMHPERDPEHWGHRNSQRRFELALEGFRWGKLGEAGDAVPLGRR